MMLQYSLCVHHNTGPITFMSHISKVWRTSLWIIIRTYSNYSMMFNTARIQEPLGHKKRSYDIYAKLITQYITGCSSCWWQWWFAIACQIRLPLRSSSSRRVAMHTMQQSLPSHSLGLHDSCTQLTVADWAVRQSNGLGMCANFTQLSCEHDTTTLLHLNP